LTRVQADTRLQHAQQPRAGFDVQAPEPLRFRGQFVRVLECGQAGGLWRQLLRHLDDLFAAALDRDGFFMQFLAAPSRQHLVLSWPQPQFVQPCPGDPDVLAFDRHRDRGIIDFNE
jgi:hypothetical protein